MNTAMKVLDPPAVDRPIPKDQMELVRRTVANGATADELALFLFDCQRQGVHPLDKLIHFTKRGGRYTPVTSIDFMRAQAAASGEMAGSDDPVFVTSDDGKPLAASVCVYRITSGQRYAYQATARWAEYCPDNAPMWRKMPFTMIAKCAEALALRKAFPKQLAGLYTTDEMDQAGSGQGRAEILDALTTPPPAAEPTPPPAPKIGGAVVITQVDPAPPGGKIVGYLEHTGQPGGADHLPLFDAYLLAFAVECCDNKTPVFVTTKPGKTSGKAYVTGIRPAEDPGVPADLAF